MRTRLAGGVAITCLVSLGLPSVAAGHRGTPWHDAVDPLGNGPGGHRLLAVEDVSSGDVWAGGFFYPQGQSHLQLLKHYDGKVWHSRLGPNKAEGSELRDFESFGSSDVWVVGDAFRSSFIGHWDGNRWRQVDHPNPADSDVLSAISGVDSDDVWAVGSAYFSSDFTTITVADHWDGATWTQVPMPNATDNNSLLAVHAITSNDVWAVGRTYDAPITEHWDGSSWSLVDQSASQGVLTKVIGFAPDDVWAVGYWEHYVNGDRQTNPLMEHWDGAEWSIVDGLHMGDLGALYGLSGTSSHDVWAVGCTLRDERLGHQTVIEHYDGGQWTRVKSPNPQPYATQCLFDVSASSATEAWAVGTYGYNDEDFGLTHNLLAHWDGTSWTWDRSPRH
jgi:hypothetical protein